MAKFTVAAGTFDDSGRVTDYTDDFPTMEAAIKAHAENSSHPWSRIELRDGDFVYDITQVRVMKRDGLYFVPCDANGRLVEH